MTKNQREFCPQCKKLVKDGKTLEFNGRMRKFHSRCYLVSIGAHFKQICQEVEHGSKK